MGKTLWVLLVLIGASPAHADDVAQVPDYSRFSDGPRWVPRPRGASQARAQALGLGTRRAASRLLAARPEERWVDAVRGHAPRQLAFPVEGARVGRGFGFTRRSRRNLHHDGVDIAAPEGTVVRAVADGIVAYSDNRIRGYGNCVIVVHAGGWVSFYAHHQRNTVQPGWRVQRGERIGFVGSTGISRGPHLHFELRIDGRLVDPTPRFRRSAPVADADADADANANAELRRFSNLLWPARGGQLARSTRRGALIDADPGTPVRAAADGVVISASRRSIVLRHRDGWVTSYSRVGRIDVTPGQRVLRGEWIARSGDRRLRFGFRDRGRRTDPERLLVHVPG